VNDLITTPFGATSTAADVSWMVSPGGTSRTATRGPHQPGIRRGVAGYAVDPANASRLWRLSLDLLASSTS
jgi:hypothetical protein